MTNNGREVFISRSEEKWQLFTATARGAITLDCQNLDQLPEQLFRFAFETIFNGSEVGEAERKEYELETNQRRFGYSRPIGSRLSFADLWWRKDKFECTKNIYFLRDCSSGFGCFEH